MELNSRLLILSAAAVLLLITGCGSNPDTAAGEEIIQEIPGQESEKYIEAFGKIKPETVKNITIDFPVKIDTIFVRPGQIVKKGEKVLSLVSLEDLEIEIRNKEYDLMEARLELNKLLAGNYSSDSGLIVLHRKNVDNHSYELEVLHNKKESGIFMDNNIICNLEKGIIKGINVSEGDYILPETNIFSIVDSSSLIVEAHIPEEFVKDVQIGNPVDIIPLADPNRVYKGTIKRKSHIAHEKNGETLVSVDIRADAIDDFLLPNYNVDIKIYPVNPGNSQ